MGRTHRTLTGALFVLLLCLGVVPQAEVRAPVSSSPAAAHVVPDPEPTRAFERALPVPRFALSNQRDVHEVLTFMRRATTADVAMLRQLGLTDPDPIVAGRALKRLADLGAVADDAAIRALLHDTRPRVRQEAVVALGRARDAASVPALGALLSSADAPLRQLILQALVSIGNEAAHALVQAALADPNTTAAERAFAR